MDMMMPVMSGLAATEYIMAHCPTPILVVSASINRGELFKTYEALAAGAVDVLEKPHGTEPDGAWERRFLAAVKLVARIRVITHPRARLTGMASDGPDRSSRERRRRANRLFDLVAIGASTGGPGAIVKSCAACRRSSACRFCSSCTSASRSEPRSRTGWTDSQPRRQLCAGRKGGLAAAGRVVIAPGDRHLIVREGRLRLTRDPERHSCRPSVDVLFESVATEYGGSAAACLLTGMGRDGAAGLLKIRQPAA